ncbi:Nucleotide exchange factor SIL1 [Ceratocystis lukuohia]|uniref:Nucleotide exchange factor SIL1 n=1 Tax=Ceratocystis lukuohia TaxID=2019550 RepID=A0ABR4MEQ9_9PEZI
MLYRPLRLNGRQSTSKRLGAKLMLALVPSILANASPLHRDQAVLHHDLICHTSNPSDCYPKIFVPTEEFQIVHDDQQLPPGLYVRMNLATGMNEAKINHPEDDRDDESLKAVLVDEHSVLTVEPSEDHHDTTVVDGPMVGYYNPGDNVSKKALPQADNIFTALNMLHKGDTEGNAALDAALESLEDISHDVYYGELMTSDYDTVAALMCFSLDPPSAGVSLDNYPRDQAASYVLGGALQNNPKALKEVMAKWDRLMMHTCGVGRGPLLDKVFSQPILAPTTSLGSTPDEIRRSAHRTRTVVNIYSGLLQDGRFRAAFLASGGMRHFLQILIREEPELVQAQRRVGQVVLDTFLDEDMGALRGQWPLAEPVEKSKASEVCRAKATETSEGCWDYHVERIMHRNRRHKDHWSKALSDALKRERKHGAGHEKTLKHYEDDEGIEEIQEEL